MDKDDLKKAIQAAQEMQADLVKAQMQLMHEEIKGHSNDHKVLVLMNGHGDFKSIKISPDLLAEGLNSVEHGVLQAIKDATEKAAALTRERLASVSQKIGL
ncbi:MAG: YbaB/EbfC family nucleoid-associated protein [Candidatus Caenarcaniphilales bacterium]|jgi:DNA-binding protein YbaB|nr:YbaB/EbfC family nucleoid-associated protein [Candidatus Caenarcaniphilales bacterium]